MGKYSRPCLLEDFEGETCQEPLGLWHICFSPDTLCLVLIFLQFPSKGLHSLIVIVVVRVCMCVHPCMGCSTHVEIRGQLSGVTSLLPWSLGIKLESSDLVAASAFTPEPSCQPDFTLPYHLECLPVAPSISEDFPLSR